MKLWLYYSWRENQAEEVEFAKNESIFLGSFFNPEAAKKMLDADQIASDDDSLEESWQMVVDDRKRKEATSNRRHRRRRVID